MYGGYDGFVDESKAQYFFEKALEISVKSKNTIAETSSGQSLGLLLSTAKNKYVKMIGLQMLI